MHEEKRLKQVYCKPKEFAEAYKYELVLSSAVSWPWSTLQSFCASWKHTLFEPRKQTGKIEEEETVLW